MDTLEFRQISKKRLRLFILVYTLVLLAILGIVLFGPDEIVLFMSSFRTGKFIAFLGAGTLLSPLLVLHKLTSHKLTLSFDDKKMVIKGNAKKTIILFADIETMELGKSRPNSLELYDINQKSGTPGKAGGLKDTEPLKAVEYLSRLKAAASQQS